jgi:hypothetical protein
MELEPIAHEDRADLADGVSRLGPFIQERTGLPALKCQRLAMSILMESEDSGVVSVARAAWLIEKIGRENS